MKVALPVAVFSSTFLTTLADKAYASTMKAPIDLLKIKKEGSSFLIPESVQSILDYILLAIEWIKNLPHHIAELSINLMGWLYELCSALILKTPIFIFDNPWFENTTYMFSMVSLGAVSVLTVLEAIKRMLSANIRGKRSTPPMELKDISKRWFIVAGVTMFVPWLFQKSFQVLNFISDILISMGGDNMKSLATLESINWFDVLVLVVFDLVLIGTIIPVLWKNGRRFFDLMVLGVTAPLALTAWIFDPYRHLFSQWWRNVKELSLVQVYYAVFLLILGLFIFGVPTPDDFMGMIAKLLVVIGGFSRMQSPPQFVSRHLDRGGGLDEALGADKTIKSVKKNFMDSASLVLKPTNLVRKAFGKDAISLKPKLKPKK